MFLFSICSNSKESSTTKFIHYKVYGGNHEWFNDSWGFNTSEELVSFFSKQPSKFLFSLFLIFAYFFSALSISEVFEDYIKDEKIKNAANKVLNISAIIFPLITIIVIFNLKI